MAWMIFFNFADKNFVVCFLVVKELKKRNVLHPPNDVILNTAASFRLWENFLVNKCFSK